MRFLLNISCPPQVFTDCDAYCLGSINCHSSVINGNQALRRLLCHLYLHFAYMLGRTHCVHFNSDFQTLWDEVFCHQFRLGHICGGTASCFSKYERYQWFIIHIKTRIRI
uniref:Uncharacterized protein n=1 Tax=Schistocephalus solidus TaxID=70667 RepID=A0A0X3NWR3_SCHSO